MSDGELVDAVFVYGTLKVGQCREKCWPLEPSKRRRAWTLGELYDTGPYPAMIAGRDQVAGQLWFYEPHQLPEVYRTLDEIEEYDPTKTNGNLYVRQIVDCFTQENELVRASTYVFAELNLLPTFRRLKPRYLFEERFFALWPEDSDW